MTTTQWKEMLNEYNETKDMIEYFREKQDEPNKERYTTKLYAYEKAISIFEGHEIGIITTEIYKGKNILTVIKVYNSDTWEDENILLEYYPVLEMLQFKNQK